MKAVIFDLDGTLLNTIDTITYYSNKALSKFGFATATADEFKYFVGNGAVKLIERALSKSGEWTSEDFENVYTYYNEIYNAEPLYLTKSFPGIFEMLTELKSAGVKIGVLSNKPDEAVQGVVKKFFGDLPDIVSGGKKGVPLKPDPAAAENILSYFGAERAVSAFVGDSGVDMMTGRNAHLHTIGVKWGFRTEDELIKNGAEHTVDEPGEIIKIVNAL